MSEADEQQRRRKARVAATPAVQPDEFIYVGVHLAPKPAATDSGRRKRRDDQRDPGTGSRRV